MPGAAALQREAEVVLQVWEWWFLKVDLPLRTHGAPHSAPCTMAKLMATQSPPPSTLHLFPPPALLPPAMAILSADMKPMTDTLMSMMAENNAKMVCLLVIACLQLGVNICGSVLISASKY